MVVFDHVLRQTHACVSGACQHIGQPHSCDNQYDDKNHNDDIYHHALSIFIVDCRVFVSCKVCDRREIRSGLTARHFSPTTCARQSPSRTEFYDTAAIIARLMAIGNHDRICPYCVHIAFASGPCRPSFKPSVAHHPIQPQLCVSARFLCFDPAHDGSAIAGNDRDRDTRPGSHGGLPMFLRQSVIWMGHDGVTFSMLPRLDTCCSIAGARWIGKQQSASGL